MLLQAAGYRSRFAPDIIAAGLAPESFGDLLTQRTRWARGNIQTARRWNPVSLPGLRWMQRWLYADGILYWHFGIFKIVFLLAPLVYLLFGVPVVDATVPSIAMFWLPYFLASFVSMGAVSGSRRSFTWTHVYEIAMAPTIAGAVLGEWIGLSTHVFAVTPKGVSTHKLNFRWRIAVPHLVLLALSLAALLNAFVFSGSHFRPDSLVITSFWACYNIVGLVMAILVCLERPRQRRTERTTVDIPIAARLWRGRPVPGRILDLSFQGARIAIAWSNGFGPAEGSRGLVPGGALLIDGVGEVSGSGRWVSETTDGMLLGFEFDTLPPARAVAIMRAITGSDDWVRHDREENAHVVGAMWRALLGATRRVTPSLRSELRLATHGVAQLHDPHLHGGEGDAGFSVHLEDLSFAGCRVRSRQRLSSGETYLVDFGETHDEPSVAEVRWVQRRHGRYIAGLQLHTATERSVRR
jgi:cellulose synthase (UDP-forming)